ncbi:SDR family NAD(P)-dependent oxidoreductase [Streptomyces chartreusis]|uniref:SDR family NAD(P)-dependent oxidoreductase n=1 Tax=Streptomyces chartreusis TaxID=1969 RepID=UPI002E19B38D
MSGIGAKWSLSRRIGKVVITFEDDVPVQPAPEPLRLDSAPTYLISGGLGGFGAATARHLAARGAQHLTLVSRRGATALEAAELLAELGTHGVQVHVHAVGVADEAQMRRVLKSQGFR